jgi:hypothetical protein
MFDRFKAQARQLVDVVLQVVHFEEQGTQFPADSKYPVEQLQFGMVSLLLEHVRQLIAVVEQVAH